MAQVGEQINADRAIDAQGMVQMGQLYVPASAVQKFRGFYGVDEQTDSASNHYAALAVAEHLPLTTAGAHTFYNAGTTGTQQIGMSPAPVAGVWQVLRGFAVSAQNATGAQQLTFQLSGIGEPLMNWYLELGSGTCPMLYVPFPSPIPASAAATQILLKTIFPAASLGRIDLALWGYNRQV